MKLSCPDCGKAVPAENINIAGMVAKCGECDSVFDFSGEIGRTAMPGADRDRPDIPQPGQVRVEKEGMVLKLIQSWFSLKFIPLLFFCIAWDSFLVFWYSMTITQEAPWIMSVFPIAHVAVGVGLTYYTLAGFLNKSIISVSYSEITVRHQPLPWPGKIRLRASEVEQFYCQEEYNRGKNGSYYTYQLSVLMKNGKKIKMLSNLDSPETVLYIERRIEEWLNIQDRPVSGEMRR